MVVQELTLVSANRTLQEWTHFQCLRLGNLLYTELSQVMVDVFVHENRPLLWFERTEERMWVLGAASCTRGDEAIDSFDELHAFALEFALYGVRSKKFRRGG